MVKKFIFKTKNAPDPGFLCSHCGKNVPITKRMGTKNRNHCPSCLWSAHVDEAISGDRKSHCGGQMEPLGLTFKKAGMDKYGKDKQGELMLIHKCARCWKYSINRIAADDKEQEILKVFERSTSIEPETLQEIENSGITILTNADSKRVHEQLFGKGV